MSVLAIDHQTDSRNQVISQGALFWAEVDVLNIGDDATALRAGLEQFGIKVNLYHAALADHIRAVLGSRNSSPRFIVINAYGDKAPGDIYLPPVAKSVGSSQSFVDRMTPDDLAQFVDVTGKIVVSNACDSGAGRLADVFLKNGKAEAYIAPVYAADGYVSYLFPILLFYFLTKYSLDIEQTFDRAKSCDPDEFTLWCMFTADSIFAPDEIPMDQAK